MSKLTLTECCSFQEGYVNPTQTKREYFDGPIKWLRASDLNDGIVYNTEKTLSIKGFESAGKSSFLFKKDTIAISKSGTIGRLGILKDVMCGNRAVINIDVNSEISDLHYIFYTLKYKKSEILSKVGGSIQKNLYVSALKTITLNHNNKFDQQKIAKVLSDLDAKIELNNKINAELEAMAKTLYDYWFVQFDFPDANGKPYKSSGGKMVWNEELKREIPERWEVKELGEIANFTTGKLDSNAEVQNGKYPFFTCASEPTMTDTFAFNDNVILIAGNNASGNFHINRFKGKFNAYQRTYIITSENPVDLEYIYQVLKTETKLLKSQGKGSQTKFLTIGMLTGIKVYRNNIKIIDNYNKITSNIYEKQVIVKQENQELASLRDWLLPMLMNGQVTVGDVIFKEEKL